jgi:hypothetical protein
MTHSQMEPGEESACGYTVTQSHGHSVLYSDVAGRGKVMMQHSYTVTWLHSLIFICNERGRGMWIQGSTVTRSYGHTVS